MRIQVCLSFKVPFRREHRDAETMEVFLDHTARRLGAVGWNWKVSDESVRLESAKWVPEGPED